MLLAPQLVLLFLGAGDPALNAASAAALRRYALSYLLMGFNILMGGFLTAVERPGRRDLRLRRARAGLSGRRAAGTGVHRRRNVHLVRAAHLGERVSGRGGGVSAAVLEIARRPRG